MKKILMAIGSGLLIMTMGSLAFAQISAPAPAPVPNKGDAAWMMISTLFYGGLVRSKNMLSVLMQVMVTLSMIVVLWFIYGYSLALTEGNPFFGGLDRLFMKGIWDSAAGTFVNAATFSKGVVIPEIVFAAFQATLVDKTIGLRVSEESEHKGLDITSHGESAYGR